MGRSWALWEEAAAAAAPVGKVWDNQLRMSGLG